MPRSMPARPQGSNASGRGRLGRRLHDVRIDGRNDSGGRLASGVYFVAIESPDGNLRSKVTILR